MVHVLTRAFYAMQDTRTPVTWAIVAVAINVPLMVLLVGPMGVDGLALALSISAVIEVIGLLWNLRGRLEGIEGADPLVAVRARPLRWSRRSSCSAGCVFDETPSPTSWPTRSAD